MGKDSTLNFFSHIFGTLRHALKDLQLYLVLQSVATEGLDANTKRTSDFNSKNKC